MSASPGFALMQTGATFSPCRRWRYSLERIWGPGQLVNVIGLNPSVADESINDPTIRRCIGFARAWGYDGLIMTNLFGLRSTDPRGLRTDDPVGPDNDRHLVESAQRAGLVIGAWGMNGGYLSRSVAVCSLLHEAGVTLHCLGETADGQPRHPLYLRADARPRPYRPMEATA